MGSMGVCRFMNDLDRLCFRKTALVVLNKLDELDKGRGWKLFETNLLQFCRKAMVRAGLY